MDIVVITPATFIHLDGQALLQTIKRVSYRATVAFQVSTQANGSGGLKRLSARGGAAYGIPRNWLIFFHSEPMRITWDLPIRSPWDGMYTDGVKSDSETGRNKSIRGERRKNNLLFQVSTISEKKINPISLNVKLLSV